MRKLFELRAKRSTKAEKLRAFIEKITIQKREFTDIEKLTIDTLQDMVTILDELIEKLEKKEEKQERMQRIRRTVNTIIAY